MSKKITTTALLVLLSLSVFGCNKKEDSKINNAISIEESFNKDKIEQPINIDDMSEEVKNTYPQSIEYFKTINEIKMLKNKEEAKELLETRAEYIDRTYPYDYSQAKDKAILKTVEDFGLMERFSITNRNHIFYEATNHENTIALNYYLEKNIYKCDSIAITTKDFNLRSEMCKIDESLKLHDFYDNIIDKLENQKGLTIKDLDILEYNYETIKMDNGIVVYKLIDDDENLIITNLKKENKISSITYNNFESFHSEGISIEDGEIEISISMNTEDLSEHKRMFHKVLDV